MNEAAVLAHPPLRPIATAVFTIAVTMATTMVASAADPCASRPACQATANRLVKLANTTVASSLALRASRHQQAAEQYLALWTDHYDQDCRKRKPACEGAQDVLYNAAQSFQAAGSGNQAIKVLRVLIDPQYRLHRTEPAKRAHVELGQLYRSIGRFARAAAWYERFARQYPKMARAPVALSDAVALRLALGQTDQAVADANLYQRLYQRRWARDAAQIAASIGAHYVDQDDWRNGERHLSRAMSLIEVHARRDDVLRSRCNLARAKLELGKTAAADRLYQQVRATWSNSTRRQKLVGRFDLSQPAEMRRLGRTLTAVAEASLHFSKQKRRAADGMERPAFKGPKTRTVLSHYLRTKLAPWLAARQSAIRQAEIDYLQVLKLRPMPPPSAVVEVTSDVAAMWASLLDELRGLPYAAAAPGQTGDQQWYRQQVGELAAAAEAQAKSAHRTCLGTSVKYLTRHDDGARCSRWLSRHFPQDYAPVLELMPRPARLGSALTERWPALTRHGPALFANR